MTVAAMSSPDLPKVAPLLVREDGGAPEISMAQTEVLGVSIAEAMPST